MDLSSLKNLGLPEWLIILAVIVFILERVGILNYALIRFTDTSEHKQQSEVKQTEHLQKSHSDALSSSLGITNRVIDHLIQTNNGRLSKIEEQQARIVGILRNVEGQQTIRNRDWPRIEEILSDIDMMLHSIVGSLKIDDKNN